MFVIGDHVSYPMHGAGTVEDIEERQVLGETRKYFRLSFLTDGVKVMVPVEGHTGLRSVMNADDAYRVLERMKSAPDEHDENWNRRYRMNLERIRTGETDEVAGVVLSLTMRDRERGLSTGERRMLQSARQILCSELAISLSVSLEEASAYLDAAIDQGADTTGEVPGVPVAR